MWYIIIILAVVISILGIYFMNIGLIRVQLEELAHRFQKGESMSGDLEEWEYYLNKLFWKPFGTKKTIDAYGPHYEDYLNAYYPDHDSAALEKYKKFKQKNS
ncbi:hypothetical protein K8O68_02775 [Salipaludibacillus sp. CUR1]|uniref:Uncharacterized protein n=1 Tax=Salipaludibacillus aurantiacus TaxID=1601833 RepID=A0A1H9TW98_9BACI|nr:MULTISPECIES: hypothetical protein [Salipaludibacillus]MCE7791345.1 hypothetical protein [Salipaludibacillus sp. CUR1]SES01187.1 hypothetical protein SAMN05518684_106115 [Salipaludibacillus aurantiacus]